MSEPFRTPGPAEALGLASAPELVSIVGGGGKSSLMFALAEGLAGRVAMTTTTRIFASQMALAPAVCRLGDEGWRDRLEVFESSVLVVGRVEGERAGGVPRELPAELLAHPRVDWVVVEAPPLSTLSAQVCKVLTLGSDFCCISDRKSTYLAYHVSMPFVSSH